MIEPQTALPYTMVMVSAADNEISDYEIERTAHPRYATA